MTNILAIHNLHKQYSAQVEALKGIDLHIENGLFGLLGPNGAGKSTLMRTIATLQAPSSGDISFNGESIIEHPYIIRQKLGYLPQSFGVYPRISAHALLEHIAVLKGITERSQRKKQVAQLLELTNLSRDKNQRVDTYSGGMLRRFGIAQALLGDPKVIIVDEPTAGLDPEERNRFLNLLSEIGQDRIILLSTHLVEDVYQLCQQMAILHKGQIQSQGQPASMVAALQNNIWHKRIKKEQLQAFQKDMTVLQTKMVGGHPVISVYCEQLPAEGFQPLAPNLEHVYFLTLNQTTSTYA